MKSYNKLHRKQSRQTFCNFWILKVIDPSSTPRHNFTFMVSNHHTKSNWWCVASDRSIKIDFEAPNSRWSPTGVLFWRSGSGRMMLQFSEFTNVCWCKEDSAGSSRRPSCTIRFWFRQILQHVQIKRSKSSLDSLPLTSINHCLASTASEYRNMLEIGERAQVSLA